MLVTVRLLNFVHDLVRRRVLAPQVSVVGKVFVPLGFVVDVNGVVMNCGCLGYVLVKVRVVLFHVALVPRVVVGNVGRLQHRVVVPRSRSHIFALVIRMVQLVVRLVFQVVL